MTASPTITLLRRALCGLIAILAIGTVMVSGRASAAIPEQPRLRLQAGADEVTYRRGRASHPVLLDVGAIMTAPDAPFEIRISRPDYELPPEVTQVVHLEQDQTEAVALPTELLNGWRGFDDFFEVLVTDAEGATIYERTRDFCPNGWGVQRINDSGPDNSRYPYGCYGNPFTKGMVWGIDQGWGTDTGMGYRYLRDVPDGDYTVVIRVTQTFQDLFDIALADSEVAVTLHVKTVECRYCHRERAASDEQATRAAEVAVQPPPGNAPLPDLESLPAWMIHLREGRKATRLAFGATVWNSGASPLVVEGFRRSDEAVMDAYQYFYSNGESVGREQVGEMEFDERDGHHHWHFTQFARYSLWNAEQTEVLRSKKEAFCVVPTDAIDVLLPGVSWRTEGGDLHSSCGQPNSLWIRETLPIGWGDTYMQSVPGQSLDVTDLPNGTYYIAVEANPDGLLVEESADNNIHLREVQLKGRPDNRHVVVPPWNGIDTEGRFRGGF